MASLPEVPNSDRSTQWRGDGVQADEVRLEAARQIALESLAEDHHALELDAKLAFGPVVVLTDRTT